MPPPRDGRSRVSVLATALGLLLAEVPTRPIAARVVAGKPGSLPAPGIGAGSAQRSVSTVDIQDSTSAAVRGSASDISR